MNGQFFAWISRLRWIKRWSLMRNTFDENVMEHSWEVATITHALALIKNRKFGGSVDVNAVTVRALYHDVSEVITADMPSSIKYHSKTIKKAYKAIEKQAVVELLDTLPDMLRADYAELIEDNEANFDNNQLIKGADSLSAYIKCRIERISGNYEFETAEKNLERELNEMNLPEVNYFMDEFVINYGRNLDQLLEA